MTLGNPSCGTGQAQKCGCVVLILFITRIFLNVQFYVMIVLFAKATSVTEYIHLLQTTSNQVQEIIESRVEKRTKGVYVPIGGKKLITFMDDFNMPAKDTFGSQPPIELMKLWLDYGFWYDREKQTQKEIRVITYRTYSS